MLNKNEIITLLTGKDGVMHISHMSAEQLVDAFGEAFRPLKGYDQNNPHHHLDLLSHTLTVVKNVLDHRLSYEDNVHLALAALLHDIGKPVVAKSKGDRTVYYDHPLASRRIADELLQAYGFDNNCIQRILFFIGYHDAFINFKLSCEIGYQKNPHLKPITYDSVIKQLHRIEFESQHEYRYMPTTDDFLLLMKLCAADASAQAETTYQNGRLVDTRCNKLNRIRSIEAIIKSVHTM